MLKQISAECQSVINIFIAKELSMKKKLNLIEKTADQKKSFRSLSLTINRVKDQETELKNVSEEVIRKQPQQSTASSKLNRQTTQLTRLNELELQVDLVDNDGQLTQSSSRIRDDISKTSSRRHLSICSNCPKTRHWRKSLISTCQSKEIFSIQMPTEILNIETSPICNRILDLHQFK